MKELTKEQKRIIKAIRDWKAQVEKWEIKAINATAKDTTIPEPPKPPILP